MLLTEVVPVPWLDPALMEKVIGARETTGIE
jgi:hypothetical protein